MKPFLHLLQLTWGDPNHGPEGARYRQQYQ